MGIKGIYQEIGPGERIALQKLAVETYEAKGRPLRLAIDISIWLFQIQSGRGGTNPALRTFYYRLLRLMAFSIHPLFVFDGPNKPPFKRDKRTGPNVASIPDFLAKQLLKQFAIPFHIAPGEAEAECALLQQRGLVDAVLSEDVDTLMFGSGLTLRSWSPEQGTGSKINTHVNLYDSQKTKAGASGLDREGMILVAMMSGGDYLPEGIPGCGPKTACEAARAGFGADLCKLRKGDRAGIAAWKERLCHELKTNESKLFTRRHKALVVPDEFPRKDILAYYTTPVISSDSQVDALRQKLVWDRPFDLAGLRTFCGEAFDWVCISGAKKFVRNIAPCMLVKELRLSAQEGDEADIERVSTREQQLVTAVHGRRQHKTTDLSDELRISYVPLDLVKIDLDAEDPDPEIPVEVEDDEDEEDAARNDEVASTQDPKRRGPYKYDPLQPEKIWMLETFVRAGAPLMVEDWEESTRKTEQAKAAKEAARVERQNARQAVCSKKSATAGGMAKGALDRFTKVTKPGVRPRVAADKSKDEARVGLSKDPFTDDFRAGRAPDQLAPRSKSPTARHAITVDLLSSSPVQPERVELRTGTGQGNHTGSPTRPETVPPELPASISIRRHRSPLRKTRTRANESRQKSPRLPSTRATVAAGLEHRETESRSRSPVRKDSVIILSSSPTASPRALRQQSITDWASPSKQRTVKLPVQTVASLDLVDGDGALDKLPAVDVSKFHERLTEASLQVPGKGVKILDSANTLDLAKKVNSAKQKRTVRIRESLEGSWTFEDSGASPKVPGAKRHRGVAATRVFAFEDVQVLDMIDDSP